MCKSDGQPIRWKERIGLVIVGNTAKIVENIIFDRLIYGAVVGFMTLKLGLLLGSAAAFAVMATLSAGLCLFYLRAYDWAKKDLFGFEMIKKARGDEVTEDGRWMRILHSIIHLGDIPAFFVLTTVYPGADPFMAVTYLRKGSEKYNGLSKRDWRIFWTAVVVANVYGVLYYTALMAILLQFFSPQTLLRWIGLN